MESEVKWEEYAIHTNRLKVEGGYLYFVQSMQSMYPVMCFVPDIDLQRYQSHLRDAYNQGFKDGQSELLSIRAEANKHDDPRCSETLACCRDGASAKLNTCVPCSIERLSKG